MSASGRATAIAHPNIALAKYWGKAPGADNVPAVPSLSVTLDGLSTRTTVQLGSAGAGDSLIFSHRSATPAETHRVTLVLNEIRALAKSDASAMVRTVNDFPTRSGLASSASGFCALTIAALAAYGVDVSLDFAADISRRASASAARSLFAGFAELVPYTKDDCGGSVPGPGHTLARQVAGPDALAMRVLVCVVTESEKAVGSREGMALTRDHSALYSVWRTFARDNFLLQREALLASDFMTLGALAEQSALTMHATALAAGVVYFQGVTLALYAEVRRLREACEPVFATMDAGPHVKVLVTPERAQAVRRHLEEVPGVLRVIETRPGGGARLTDEHVVFALTQTAVGKLHGRGEDRQSPGGTGGSESVGEGRKTVATYALAPGKLVLAGAYAILEGAPAVVMAVDRYAVARWAHPSAPPARPLGPELQRAFPNGGSPLVDTSSFVSRGRKLGLGSSAACVVSALRLAEPTLAPDALFARAAAVHREAQGGGSGIDIAASTFGGVIRFAMPNVVTRLRPLRLVMAVFFSGRSAKTTEFVARMQRQRERSPAHAARYRIAIDAVKEATERVLADWDSGDLVSAFSEYGNALEQLGVFAELPIVPEDFQVLAAAAARDGGVFFPAGAGGGDVGVYLHATSAPSLSFVAAAEALGFERQETQTAPTGARIETDAGARFYNQEEMQP